MIAELAKDNPDAIPAMPTDDHAKNAHRKKNSRPLFEFNACVARPVGKKEIQQMEEIQQMKGSYQMNRRSRMEKT